MQAEEASGDEVERAFAGALKGPEGKETPRFEALLEERPDLEVDLRELIEIRRRLKTVRDGASAPSGLCEVLGDRCQLAGALHSLVAGNDLDVRYFPFEDLGRGGMGSVRAVWDSVLRRRVAMKRSHVSLTDCGLQRQERATARRVHRFVDEAHVMARLNHPGVVPVYDLGVSPRGHVFFTMELIQGESLRSAIPEAPGGARGLPLVQALSALVDASRTLAFAHSEGVIHRDVKPSNVLIGNSGRVYVIDWGLAWERDRVGCEPVWESHIVRARHWRPDRLSGRSVVGTPGYMAPECLDDTEARIGPWTDVYSLGATLYEIVSGTAPHGLPVSDEITLGKLRSLSGVAPEPLASLAPDTPARLAEICERALATETEDRYPSATLLAEELHAFLGSEGADGQVVPRA